MQYDDLDLKWTKMSLEDNRALKMDAKKDIGQDTIYDNSSRVTTDKQPI